MSSPTNRELATAFIVGGSIVAGLVSFAYIGGGMRRFRTRYPTKLFNSFEWMMAGLLITLGIFNVGIYWLSETYEEELNEIGYSKRLPMIIGGAIFGLVLSLTGKNLYDFPIKAYSFTRKTEWIAHIIDMILYSLVFGYIIYPVNQYIL